METTNKKEKLSTWAKIDRQCRSFAHNKQTGEVMGRSNKSWDIQPDVYWEDEQCDVDQESSSNIQKTDQGYVVYCNNIPSYFFKFICGKQHESKTRIEKETNTKINIPRPGIEGDIVIRGPERYGVLSAKSSIELIVDDARKRSKRTHFISIPLVCESTKERFLIFKDLVLQECTECRGFDEGIIQIPEKLHLTMGVMVLMSEKEIERAAAVLQELQGEIQSNFINQEPLKVILEGVDCMNNDPSKVVVLYAKVKLADGTDRLQRMADHIVEKFVSVGLMRKEYDSVKLHATVINTNFKEEADKNQDVTSNKPENRRHKVTYFDARKVFELCDNFKFGEVDCTVLHLSKRGQYGPDGFYHCESFVQL